MKKTLALLAFIATSSAFAGGGHYGTQYHNRGSDIGPVIIGGIIGYALGSANSQTVIVPQQQYPYPQPMPQPQVYINGVKTYQLVTPPPYIGATPLYQQNTEFDIRCNCYTVVYQQIGWK